MKLSRILKKLPVALIGEMNQMDEAALNKVIASSEDAIAKATRERDANTKYQAAKQAVKDLSYGLKDVKAYESARKHFALRRLAELRGEPVGD